MSLNFGKPGTQRVKGLQRLQLAKVEALCQHLLAYQTKNAGRVPPVPFLSAPQITAFTNAALEAGVLLAQRNT
jgi:hypothetical protein